MEVKVQGNGKASRGIQLLKKMLGQFGRWGEPAAAGMGGSFGAGSLCSHRKRDDGANQAVRDL